MDKPIRALAISLTIALCTAAPSLYAQFTMGGLGTSMGIMGGMQGMGSNAGSIGMGAINGMQQGMGGVVGAYATLAAQVFAVSAAFQFLQSASNIRNLIEGQEAMGAITGRTYKSITASIIEATDAQLKYADAAKAAAIGSAAGLTTSQLTKLGTVAKNASFALGRDLTDSFNRLIRGVTKAEPELSYTVKPASHKAPQSALL